MLPRGNEMRPLRQGRRAIPAVVVLIAAVMGAVALLHHGPGAPPFRTARAQLGTVTQTVDVTGTVQPLTEIYRDLGATPAFQVSAPVSDAQVSQIRLGDPVHVVPAGVHELLLGRVVGIAPAALITNGIATFTVTAVVDDGSHISEFHPGSSAQVSIVVEQVIDVLTVPTSAVHTVGPTTFVFVPRDGEEVRQPVTVGVRDPVRTQITSGLNVGEEVVVAP